MSIKLVFDTVTELNEFFNSMSLLKQEPIMVPQSNVNDDLFLQPDGMVEDDDEMECTVVLDQYFEEPIQDVEEKHPWNDSYIYDWTDNCLRTHDARGKRIHIRAGEILDILDMARGSEYSAEQIYDEYDFSSETVCLHTIQLFLLRCKEGRMTRAVENICNNEHIKEDFSRYKVILDEMKEE